MGLLYPAETPDLCEVTTSTLCHLTCCMTSDEPLFLSGPQFLHSVKCKDGQAAAFSNDDRQKPHHAELGRPVCGPRAPMAGECLERACLD